MNVEFFDIEDDIYVAFFSATGRFFKINKCTKEVIKNVASGGIYDDLSEETKALVSCDSYTENEGKISELLTEQISENVIIPEKKELRRLVLNISSDCNLKCRYCYACEGKYGSQQGMMSMDILKKSLDTFYSHFDNIGSIQLFGGEPLLNMEAIEYVCNYVLDKAKKTSVGLVTNGTLINEKFIELVKKYGIHVTVSYDGINSINDYSRPYKSGKGTSEDIINNIKRLKEKTDEPKTIEVTFNRYHAKNGVSIVDITKSIRSMFPQMGIHIAPVLGPENADYVLESYEPFVNSVEDIICEGCGPISYSLVDRIINRISDPSRRNITICDAGVGTLSVSKDGDIYPCFMFTDEEELCLGNIKDEDVFVGRLFSETIKKIMMINLKTENPKCKECVARTICDGCLGMNTKLASGQFAMNDSICDMFRKMIEKTVIQCFKTGLFEKLQKKVSEE